MGSRVRQGSRRERVVRSSSVKPIQQYGRAEHNPEHRLHGQIE